MEIREFDDIDGLVTEIIIDKNTQDILSRRFPVRLIFLQRFETFRVLVEKLASINIDIYHLEGDLPKPDGWITKDSLINIVSCIRNSTAIVPFSEIVRFYSRQDFKNFFSNLMLIENISDLSRRIYLPLIGIEQRFEKDFFQGFSRKNECAPIWGIPKEEPNSIQVLLYSHPPTNKIKKYELLKDTEEWLKFWKVNSPSNVVCCSKPLNLYYGNTLPDTIFSIHKFINAKELIEKIYDLEIPISYMEVDKDHWEKLLDLMNHNFDNYSNFVKKYFMVTTLTINNILDIWLKIDDSFGRWLLKNYILSQKCLQNKYVYKVFELLSDYTDQSLLKNLYLAIFTLEIKEEYIDDRFNLIKQFSSYKPVNLCDEVVSELDLKIRSLSDRHQALVLMTGMLYFEKQLIFEYYINNQVEDESLLTQHYPDLSNYFSDATFDNIVIGQEWIYEYISEYKKSKITNKVTERLISLLSELNATPNSFYSWYNGFEAISSLIHSIKVDKIILVDALGVEWTGFIENIINRKGKNLKVVKNLIGVANLPSSTDQNRIPEAKYIQDFDTLVHNNIYSYPYSIISQFNELSNIIEENLLLNSNQTVAIVSDHGLTALSRLFESKKYGKDDSHEGRYIEANSKEHTEDPDYLIHKSEVDQKHYLIALKHNSLGKKPRRETHGGCTPEEVLVPIIIVSNKMDESIIEYLISIEKTEITKKEPFLLINITPKPISADIEIVGKTKKLKYNILNGKWEVSIDKSISGKALVKVKVGKTEKSFTINIITGIIEEDLF